MPPEWINWFEWLDIEDLTLSFDWWYLDQINKSWEKGVTFNRPVINNNELIFELSSIVPFSNTWSFEFDLKGENSYSNLKYNITIGFKKLFIWAFNVSNNDWNSWWDLPEIGTEQKYKIILTNVWNLVGFSNWILGISISTLKNNITDHLFENIWNISNEFLNNESVYLWFTARINADDNILKMPIVSSNKLPISYTFEWKTIKHYLTKTTASNLEEFTIWDDWDLSTLWLKVVWTLQWDWKSDITWQDENFSDLSKAELRSIVRKNAYLAIKNMQNGQVLNWVKYVIWDYTISWDNLWYETIVVKDWNLIINWDLNNPWNKLWIIVLKDGYSVTTDYINKWNIYINNNVTYIDAIMYADWWVLASKNWIVYTTDNSTRTSELQNQLIIKWSLFTRNTIWWAVIAWWDYLLPWWSTTNSFNNAMIYDLNYLRRWNEWNDGSYLDYTIVIYNPLVQTNPPKLFNN